ncbi:MAG: FKBP-type peptidyl-prolyl cis-trans isomerase [Actinomycetales bacterium]
MRRLLVCLFVLVLALAGCGGSGTQAEGLDAITVTGEPDAKPEVTFDTPFSVTQTQTKTLVEGDSEEVVAVGEKVTVNYVGINGTDGKQFDSSFDNGGPTDFTLSEGGLIKGFITALDGAKVGSRVLVAIPPADGYGSQGQPAAGIRGDDTLIFVIDVIGTRTVLEKAEGTAVAPTPGNPTVTVDEQGVPSVTVPQGPPPSQLVVAPLITGTGAPITAGQTATTNYVVVAWSNGQVIESSWEKGQPGAMSVGSGRLLSGVDAGLLGQPVGSQILIVVPQPEGIDPAMVPTQDPSASAPPVVKPDALVFVIDILDAS